MTEDEADLPAVETANGSFYHAYKEQLEDFALNIERAGASALESTSFHKKDKFELEVGLYKVQRELKDLPRLLARIIDENEPSFFQECAIGSVLEMIEGVFLISKHLHFTDSAAQRALVNQAAFARGGRSEVLAKSKAVRIELVKRHAASLGVDLNHPYVAAGDMLDAINEERAKAGKPNVTTRTVQNWINEAKEN